MTDATLATQASPEPLFAVNASRGFVDWLREQRASLAVTTYQVGKLLFFGVKPDGKLWVFNRNIGRCLGLAVAGADLWVTGDYQIYRMVDAMESGGSGAGHDAFYVPQTAYYTGDVDAHDLAVTADGRLIFVNTLFNCLAEVSDRYSFRPLWKPPFISKLAAEDRCHLNGLAMRDGQPAYVTAVAASDTFDGWRDQRSTGGIVIDVASSETIADGLSMPHSPRWHGGRLWLHNSGTGEFGTLDIGSGRFTPVCFCPGYLRGLSFLGDYAIAGLSRPRDNRTFTGLALDAELERRKMSARCGLYVIDLKTGDVAHSLTLDGIVTELYDVAAIPGKLQPAGLGPQSPELKRTISMAPQ